METKAQNISADAMDVTAQSAPGGSGPCTPKKFTMNGVQGESDEYTTEAGKTCVGSSKYAEAVKTARERAEENLAKGMEGTCDGSCGGTDTCGPYVVTPTFSPSVETVSNDGNNPPVLTCRVTCTMDAECICACPETKKTPKNQASSM